MRTGLSLVLCLSISCVGSGTSDGDSASTFPGECGTFTACGGDPVGEWDLVSMCLYDVQALGNSGVDQPECQNVFRGVDYNVTGSFMMDASGNATIELSANMDFDFVYNQACVTALGGPQLTSAECASLEESLVQSTDSPFEGGACTFSPGQCSCLVTYMPIMDSSSGTLTQKGDTLVNSSGEAESFCIKGDTLELTSTSTVGSGVLTFKRRT